MIDDDDMDARLSAFASAEQPWQLEDGTTRVRRRISGQRPPRPPSGGTVAVAIGISALVGMAGAALPSTPAAATGPALQPAMALAPSTLLGPR